MKKLLLFILLIIAGHLHAQVVGNFSLKDATSGKEVSLNDFSDKKGVVIIFTSNVCPYSVYYEGRITQLIADFDNKDIQFVLINAHQEDKESLTQMSNKIETWGLDVPYLADKEHKAMEALGARKSPEAFLLKSSTKGFTVFYNGAIDNNPQVASDVKNAYLRENINALLQGKAATRGGRPIGCMIK